MKIKVLQIVDNISKDSGVSSVLMNYYRELDKKLFQFDFLVSRKDTSDKTYYQEIKSLGGKIYTTHSPLSPKEVLKGTEEIRDVLRVHAKEYDVFHIHTPSMSSFVVGEIKKQTLAPIVIHSHSSMSSTNRIKAFLNSILTRKCAEYASAYVACSEEAAIFLFGEKKIKEKGIFYLNNAIYPEIYLFDEFKREEIRNNLQIENSRTLIHVSNFSLIKNVQFLFDIAVMLTKKDNRKYTLLLVGDGPEREKLERKFKEELPEFKVIFVGKTNRVADYLNAADIFLLPSLKEGLPVSVVEAEACGLKCILNDTITKSVDLGLVSYLTLNSEIWTEKIKSINWSIKDRKSASKGFANTLFNIKKSVAQLQHFYADISKSSMD